MSTCLYPPVNNQPINACQSEPPAPPKVRQTMIWEEWCINCQAYKGSGHLHTPDAGISPLVAPLEKMSREEFKEKYPTIEKPELDFRKLNEAIDCLDSHGSKPTSETKMIEDLLEQVTKVSFNYHKMQSNLREFEKEKVHPLYDSIAGIKLSIDKLFRWLNDLSELRHETNQNEGCTRAKVENDLIPQVTMLWDDMSKLRKNFDSLCEHMGTRTVDFVIKDCEFHKRLEKLEQTPCMTEWVNKTESRFEKLENLVHPKIDGCDRAESFLQVIRRLEKQNEKLKNRMEHLERRVSNALPEIVKSIPDMPSNDDIKLNDLLGRIKELERFQDITHAQYQKVITAKVPHKCPICSGTCIRPEYVIGSCLMKNQPCGVCEGGIVWG